MRQIGLLWVLFVVLMPQWHAAAQAVHPDVYLNQTSPATFTRLDALREGEQPQIGLFYATGTARLNPLLTSTVDKSVRLWEHFLIGMDLPYVVLEDSSLARNLSAGIRLLIMPNAEVLSERDQDALRSYLQAGGGLIASGRVAFLDERGVLQNDRYFKEIFGAEPSIDLPDSLNGLLQTIKGGHPPTNGIAPGYQLNIKRPALGTAVIPLESTSMGPLVTYQRLDVRLIEQALEASTLLLRGMYGEGRFVWMGFNPQDVSLDEEQQAAYQGLVLNAMAHVARVPTLSVRRWPHGFTSAASFAVLPTLGYQPYTYRLGMDLVLNALEEAKVKGTYFIVTSQADDHPDVIDRAVAQGELALTSDTDAMLAKQPLDLQKNRVRLSKDKLGKLGGDVRGFYPPGGFYDPNTLRVMVDLELDYMLSDARTLNVPAFVRWEDELDYRDVVLDENEEVEEGNTTVDLAPIVSDQDEVVTLYPSLFSYALDDRSGLQGHEDIREQWRNKLEENFLNQHTAEGLFLFAFEPETMGLTQQRARVLESFARYVRTQNTWIATLGDLSSWWTARKNVIAAIDSVAHDGYAITLHNLGEETVEGLSLDFAFDAGAHRILEVEADNLDVWSKRDPATLLVVVDALPPGQHQIRLVDPSIASENDVE